MSAVLNAASATSRAHGRLWGAAQVVAMENGTLESIELLRSALAAVAVAEAELSEALASRPDAWPARGWRIAS
jgi:hypothetical protein